MVSMSNIEHFRLVFADRETRAQKELAYRSLVSNETRVIDPRLSAEIRVSRETRRR